MSFDNEDIEKRGPIVDDFSNGGPVRGDTYEFGNGKYAKLHALAAKFGIEQRGIERVPEDERHDNSLSNVGTMWLSANMVISSVAIGVLGPSIWALGFADSCLAILFFNLLSILPVCFFSTFGPRFGLRQMVLSRFYFGFYAVKIIAFLNCLACIGWSAVNVIVGAQLITTVNHNVPYWAGIIIIAAITFIITLFGYKIVHSYEKWSWIPVAIIFIIVIARYKISGAFINKPMRSGFAISGGTSAMSEPGGVFSTDPVVFADSTGPLEAAGILSFGAAIFGFGTGWTSYAADYTVYHPSNQSRTKVFLWTWLGLIFPLLFTEMLGAAIYMGTYTNPVFFEAYEKNSVGGLLGAVLVTNSLGNFGNFCLIVLALSIIANNCPNIYSIGLSVQVFSRHLQAVPRFVWTFIGTLCYVAIAIPGAKHFESVLENFMNLIGYWLAIYEGISLSEHFFFRKGFTGYNPEDYDKPGKLPPGIAATIAFLFGILGAVMGMAGLWFVGPVAKKTGNPIYGGDVGFELAFAFSALTYCCLRPFEKKRFGR